MGEVRDRLGTKVEREAGVHGVVREERRLRERDSAGVRVLERLDTRVVTLEERSGEVLRRPRVDLSLHGLREDEHLEGRPRLPLPVGRDVERDPLPGLGDGHRADLARRGLDRDDRARRIVLSVERAENGVGRRRLHLRVERRVDVQPAAADSLRARN